MSKTRSRLLTGTVFLAGVLIAVQASAQNPPAAGGPAAPGAPAATGAAAAPAGAARPPWTVACEADVNKFCAAEAKAKTDVRPCLAKKDTELSESCQEVFLKGYKVLELCKDDIDKYCKDAQGKGLGKCFNDNQAKLSEKCKTALRRGSKEHQQEKAAAGGPAAPEAKPATAAAKPGKGKKKSKKAAN
jgi:hypothetical protein